MSKTYLNGTTLVPNDGPITDNDYGGVDWRVSNYDGSQKPTLTNHYLYSGPSSNNRAQEVREFLRYTYDNAQRLTHIKYDYARLGAQPVEPTFILSNMNYNYKDQLVEKNTAFVNNKYLQSTDFAYNNRGWLTSINSGFLNSTLDYPLFNNTNNNTSYYSSLGTTGFLTPPAQAGEHNPDLFMEKIRYEDPNSGLPNSAPAQYNGNISQLEWQVAGRERQAYSLKYDDLDRLTEANYADIHTGFWYQNGWTSAYETDNKYKENVSYDRRGNIQSIARNGLTGNYMSNVIIGYYNLQDFMSYTYNPADLNKLDKIYDGANLTKGFKTLNNNSVFTYDANGNLKSDLNKNITLITYNHLNLPLVITFTNDASNQPRRIEFIYDATGAKLRKTTYLNNVVQEKRDYVNGVECRNDVLDRFATTEGAVVRQADLVTFMHEYTIKDHLGNARVTYSDANNDGTITVADMKQINHYYPFGMNMEGNWNGPSGKNKYQYNEKELNSDFGLDWNDYGARFYDAAIGRWNGVDLLSELYYSYSPYNYVRNNPISRIDPNGMADEDVMRGRSDPLGRSRGVIPSSGDPNGSNAPSTWSGVMVTQGQPVSMDKKSSYGYQPRDMSDESFQQQPGGELSQHANEARSINDFARENNGISRTDLITQAPRITMRPGGPLMRYVFDPLNPNVVIDMRHMLVVGKWGTNAGIAVEAFQTITFNDSGWNEQDFYSNALGSGFYHYLESLQRRGDIPLTCGNCAFLRGADFVNRLQIFMNSTELRNKFVPQDDTYNQVNRR
jgi:RHS repeat-associated protein